MIVVTANGILQLSSNH